MASSMLQGTLGFIVTTSTQFIQRFPRNKRTYKDPFARFRKQGKVQYAHLIMDKINGFFFQAMEVVGGVNLAKNTHG